MFFFVWEIFLLEKSVCIGEFEFWGGFRIGIYYEFWFWYCVGGGWILLFYIDSKCMLLVIFK